MSEGFPCTSCGLCCKKVGQTIKNLSFASPIYAKHLAKFPYKYDEDGVCEKFVDGKCSVYDERPDICNIATMADHHNIARDIYFHIAAYACNLMINDADLDEEYLVRIDN